MRQIHQRVKRLRKDQGLSQQQVADKLDMSRQTYSELERGNRSVTMQELDTLSDFFQVELADLIQREATSNYDLEKYKQMVMQAIKAGGANSDGKITKTKLAKLLYLADFSWFYNHLEPMSGLKYRRIQHGPVPDEYFRVVDELHEEQAISIEAKDAALLISLIEEPDQNGALSEEEQSLIKQIGRKWQGKRTQTIEDFTHQQLPWKLCRAGEIIPYELITQEDPGRVY